ncbi:hypothetical protein ACFV6D_23890 [Kitasatospora sp. NPDC059812]|uniref:hypothetical protein n=1 Tax=Kitasatospora sp. NPDC059812 TaxID=3346958 RepID=UPI00364F1DBA
MHPCAAPEARPRRAAWAAWAAPVLVNVALGLAAMVPLMFTLVFFLNYPLVWLGLGQREPTENDGPMVWVVAGVVVWTVFGLLWWLVNLGLRSLTGLRGRRYWWVSAGLLLVPTVVFSPLPAGPWTVLRWLA